MKANKKFSLIVLLIIGLGIIYVSIYMGLYIFRASTQMRDNEETSLESLEADLEKADYFDLADFRAEYSIERIAIESSTGDHTIPADHIIVDDNRYNDTVVMVHGLGGNRLSVYPQAEIFLQNGFNVIAYDQRSSGENYAAYNTYGYLESNDLKDYINYLQDILGEDKIIGVWGLSFGGATAGIYSGTDHANDNIDFAVLDSALSSMRYVISQELEQMVNGPLSGLLVDYLTFVGNIFNRIKLGFSYDDASVCRAIENTEVPMLIIHSRADEITPYFMGKNIYEAVEHENKNKLTVETSEHGNIHRDYPQEYENNIMSLKNDLDD